MTLGEGWTPLIDTPDFDCESKLEYVFPTGIFKYRGAATTPSRAVEIGTERVVEDSSGNAGAAIATYAAHAGIDAEIYVPAEVKDSKLRAIRQASASVVRVSRSREAVTNACIERADGGRANEAAVENGGTDDRNDDGESENERNDTEAWYASHTWNPAFYAGTKTVALEIAYQRGWEAPDALVLPLGHGTLFFGAYRGFRALYDAGWTEEIPRLYGAQAAGYDPIARELHSNQGARQVHRAETGMETRMKT